MLKKSFFTVRERIAEIHGDHRPVSVSNSSSATRVGGPRIVKQNMTPSYDYCFVISLNLSLSMDANDTSSSLQTMVLTVAFVKFAICAPRSPFDLQESQPARFLEFIILYHYSVFQNRPKSNGRRSSALRLHPSVRSWIPSRNRSLARPQVPPNIQEPLSFYIFKLLLFFIIFYNIFNFSFRFRRETVEKIARELEENAESSEILLQGHRGRHALEVKVQLEIFLYRLAERGII